MAHECELHAVGKSVPVLCVEDRQEHHVEARAAHDSSHAGHTRRVRDFRDLDLYGPLVHLYEDKNLCGIGNGRESFEHISRLELYRGTETRFGIREHAVRHPGTDDESRRLDEIFTGRNGVAVHLNGGNYLPTACRLRRRRRREQDKHDGDESEGCAHVSVDDWMARDTGPRLRPRGSRSTRCRSASRRGRRRARTSRRHRPASAATRREMLRSWPCWQSDQRPARATTPEEIRAQYCQTCTSQSVSGSARPTASRGTLCSSAAGPRRRTLRRATCVEPPDSHVPPRACPDCR